MPKTRQIDVVFEPVMRSTSMRRIDSTLRVVAPKDVLVTLIGESGTGKEVLARRVHELSERRSSPFVPINCAAIPESLFESELFGHERGAFTGAHERAKGKVEAAERGTLFLDEIAEMPLAMQAKLLRFLENRRFMRVGGSTKIHADVRLIFATLRPLQDEVRAGRFRGDLYYRIQGITLQVPALRARRADIPLLIEQFVAQMAARHSSPPPKLTRRARAVLIDYDWPGNVRELRNVIEMVCLLRAGRSVRFRDLPEALQSAARKTSEAGPPRSIQLDLAQPLAAMVEEIIETVVAAEAGNRTRAAERLGISIRTIQRHSAQKQLSSRRARSAKQRAKSSHGASDHRPQG